MLREAWLTSKLPQIKVKLHTSSFGFGAVYDKVSLEPNNQVSEVTVPLVIALVEGTLGYQLLYTDARVWSFRRTQEFR